MVNNSNVKRLILIGTSKLDIKPAYIPVAGNAT